MKDKSIVSADSIHEKLKQIDTYQLNHSYLEEKQAYRLIQAGDLNGIKELLKKGIWSYPAPIKNPIKNAEYMLVSTVSVIARVAIEAGVPPQNALLYSDAFLSSISTCTTEKEFLDTYEQIIVTYTSLVKQYREQKSGNYLALRAEKYIYDNIFEKLSLSGIAEQMGVSEEHLARIFKTETGLTVSQYIAQEKINIAANLLKDSNRSVNEIASYLQFQSPSYFITLFKRVKHMTPTEYRKASIL